MKDIEIHSDTVLNPLGRERYYQGSVGKAVLLLHGFTGWTEEMDYLGRAINQKTGFTVYIPRLPGHGTTASDFRESKARDWLRKTYDSYLMLTRDHQEVYPAGLSMGGLLAILTAARFKCAKLILIAAAVDTRHRLLPFSHLLKYLRPVVPIKGSSKSDIEFSSKYERIHYENYRTRYYSAQAAELHKLILMGRKKLSLVTADTLIIASRKDGSVPLKAAERIKKGVKGSKKLYIFDQSPHVINNGPEREKCARLIVDYLID